MTDQERDELQRAYPRWRLWRGRHEDGSPGDLYATRRRSLSDAEIEAGLACTLPMGLTGDLREQLAEQDGLGT